MIDSPPRSIALTAEDVIAYSRRLSEPEWLLRLRLEAQAALARLPLAETSTGNWRRTSLAGFSLDSVRAPVAWQPSAPEGSTASNAVRVVDLAEAVHDPALAPIVQAHLGQVVRPDEDTLTALHYALFNAGTLVYVPRNVVVEGVVHLVQAFEAAAAVPMRHTLVVVEQGADVAVVEELRSSASAGAISSGVVEIVAGRNSQVRFIQAQEWSDQTWSFNNQRARIEADAQVKILDIALGGLQIRNNVQVILEGRGSQADLLGVVLGHGAQHVDFQTLQDHHGNATRSDLVIHNALLDESSSNFTGLIRINRSAHGTESSQEQKNVLLSPRAKADSDPKLEILNNDVIRCTHGASIGPLDPEQIFYLQARGLTAAEATSLVLEGFFRTVVERLQRPAVEEVAWNALRRTLARHGAA